MNPYSEYFIREAKGQLHEQMGDGLDVFQGPYSQRGCGLGSLFSSFFSRFIPFAKSMLPVIGRSAWESGKDAVREIASGEHGPTVLRKRGKEFGAKILHGVADKMTGGRLKKKRAKKLHCLPKVHKIRRIGTIFEGIKG
jgi:hypothetical protein